MTAEPRLAATVLLARDNAGSMELCMIVRNRQIDFASGALVFPGGSVDASDHEARDVAGGADGLDDAALALRVAAVREAFEECGVLLARRDGALIGGDEAGRLTEAYRTRLEGREISMAEIARAEGLSLATDLMTPFAHWVTPSFMKKRFDTHFFIVAAPPDHVLAHDGGEAVDALWIRPAAALEEAAAGAKTLVFATWLNVALAGEAANAADALARAASRPLVRVEPTLAKEGDRKVMRIPADAGYSHAAWAIEDIAKPPTPLFED